MSRRRRRLAALLALCAVVSLSLGVGGYSSVSADRNVSVNVAPPEEAYLAFSDNLQCGAGNGVGDNKHFVKNQFAGNTTIDRIEVEVTAVDGSVRVGDGTGGTTTPVSAGEPTELVFDGPYEPGDSASVLIKPPRGNVSRADKLRVEIVEATGSGVRVAETKITYDVSCPGGPPANNTTQGEGTG